MLHTCAPRGGDLLTLGSQARKVKGKQALTDPLSTGKGELEAAQHGKEPPKCGTLLKSTLKKS